MRTTEKQVEVKEREIKTKQISGTEVLPRVLLNYIFGFLRPTEVAFMAAVSKSFLSQASLSMDRSIDFSPVRYKAFRDLMNTQTLDSKLTDLHRALLLPKHQITPTGWRGIFQFFHGLIFKGRLSPEAAIEGIQYTE